MDALEVDDFILVGATGTTLEKHRPRTQATGVVGNQRGSVRLRFTDTFIKRHGQWQAVASHATTLAR
jgi:hypothetical protein